ncbi:glycosyltransferase [candidate division KSB1 bacterium]|nr:glycosyltransferase [candidate division KSB1 bacterium]MBL7095336.1 glycosyltransferase [candidate division KSB1 bacterium]
MTEGLIGMKKVSILMIYNEKLGYENNEFNKSVRSLVNQNYENWELILVDERGEKAQYPEILKHEKIKHVPCRFKNRANSINQALKVCTGDYVMLVNNEQSLITFRLSTLEIFLRVAERHQNTGMVYSDNRLIEADGSEKDIHLLDYHEGRLRDNLDFGAVLFFPKLVLDEIGGLNEKYKAAFIYDLRLRISERYQIVHVAARQNGHLYYAHAAAKEFNVFDYLLAGKDVQLEMEDAVSEHLKRIGAYLLPEQNYHHFKYSTVEEKKFEECIASVVIPVFDREEFIGTAIESVQAQTIQKVEVIVVVNGGEDDPTIKGVKPYLPGGEKYDPVKPTVKLIVEDINNIGHCLNKGLRQASGKYYVQLDSDDRLKPDAVEKLVEVFDADDRIGMVIGSYEVWQQDDTTGEITRMEEIPVVTHDEWSEENGRNNLLRINGAGAPRSGHIKIMLQLGGFDMNDSDQCRNYGEDYDLVMRMSEQYKIGRVWQPIYDVIRHSGGTDHNIDQATIDRNDNAKDFMRLEAVGRRKKINSPAQ